MDVRFACAEDGTQIAYRILDAESSEEPVRDVVMVAGGLIPFEVFEEEPGFARLLDGLRSLGRVVVFDRRGVGQSDPVPDWERSVVDQWTDDLGAVVDAAGARDIVLVTWKQLELSPAAVAFIDLLREECNRWAKLEMGPPASETPTEG